MYSIKYTTQFKKKLKLCEKRGLDMGLLLDVIDLLAKDGCLPPQYKPHQLKGRFVGIWECHIQPDWLLLWQQHDDEFTLLMIDTGTHSDIFKR